MPATATATATRPARTGRPQAPRLPRNARRFLLTAHVVTSVGWLGVAYALLVMALSAQAADDAGTRAATYSLMLSFDTAAMLPLGLAALVTGVILGLGTHWGVLRHWWVAVKLVLNVAVLVVPMLTRHPALVDAVDTARAGLLTAPDGRVLDGSIASVIVLTAATVLSVYKPWGKTRARCN
ncbi:hypothetical protein CS0771_30600 [Catellatospora sp. IY07-71]|uniref:hypothetical protein n=1 Tax=Catellatospora sp. IY07-71 TaxID=2728827 RepID=UPI001BB3F201|nr:hypothetical protein [Catellatospora sp. IY07-71]BCJ73516.1 hypothetical protein CS0771_30600 [Catellatospora sp. IY07-71]